MPTLTVFAPKKTVWRQAGHWNSREGAIIDRAFTEAADPVPDNEPPGWEGRILYRQGYQYYPSEGMLDELRKAGYERFISRLEVAEPVTEREHTPVFSLNTAQRELEGLKARVTALEAETAREGGTLTSARSLEDLDEGNTL